MASQRGPGIQARQRKQAAEENAAYAAEPAPDPNAPRTFCDGCGNWVRNGVVADHDSTERPGVATCPEAWPF